MRAWPGVHGPATTLAEREGFEPPLRCRKPHFECGAFDHSATSPFARITADPDESGKLYQTAQRLAVRAPDSADRPELLDAAQVRLQRLRNAHAAIGLLIILQHRHQRAAHRQA